MLPPVLKDDLCLLCPEDQGSYSVLRVIRVTVMVQVHWFSSLAAGTVRNAVQDVQKSSQ